MNKKSILAILLALAMIFSLAACSKDDAAEDESGSESTAAQSYSAGLDENGFFEGITAKDYVTLGQYEGLTVPADQLAITQAEIETEIDGLVSNYTDTKEVTDRAAQLGDTVNIDYEGFMDGEQFEGGTGNNPSLVLGSGSFIAGFEDGIVGHEEFSRAVHARAVFVEQQVYGFAAFVEHFVIGDGDPCRILLDGGAPFALAIHGHRHNGRRHVGLYAEAGRLLVEAKCALSFWFVLVVVATGSEVHAQPCDDDGCKHNVEILFHVHLLFFLNDLTFMALLCTPRRPSSSEY